MKRNPFVLSPFIPDDFFCDRVTESKALIRSLSNQENVVLISPRRVGKTGLIYHCFNQESIKDNYITISIDILHTTSFQEFIMELGSSVFKTVAKRSDRLMKLFTSYLRSLSGSFGYDPVAGTPTFDIKLGQIKMPEYTLDEILSYLENADKPCIVAIDEFQQILKYQGTNMEALLRGRIQKLQNTNFIFAGSERRIMNEMFFSEKRPFFQSATLLQLEPIELAVYTDFVSKHFQEAQKMIDKEAIEWAYQCYDGITMYTHRLFHDAFVETDEGECCGVSEMKALSMMLIQQNAKRLQELLAYITEQQKELLYAIAADGQSARVTSSAFVKRHHLKSASAVQSAVKKLLDYDLITEQNKTYSIVDPLLRIWLRSNLV
jgi:AAA+ ATPase superfamily predicted ATPase